MKVPWQPPCLLHQPSISFFGPQCHWQLVSHVIGCSQQTWAQFGSVLWEMWTIYNSLKFVLSSALPDKDQVLTDNGTALERSHACFHASAPHHSDSRHSFCRAQILGPAWLALLPKNVPGAILFFSDALTASHCICFRAFLCFSSK